MDKKEKLKPVPKVVKKDKPSKNDPKTFLATLAMLKKTKKPNEEDEIRGRSIEPRRQRNSKRDRSENDVAGCEIQPLQPQPRGKSIPRPQSRGRSIPPARKKSETPRTKSEPKKPKSRSPKSNRRNKGPPKNGG